MQNACSVVFRGAPTCQESYELIQKGRCAMLPGTDLLLNGGIQYTVFVPVVLSQSVVLSPSATAIHLNQDIVGIVKEE